MRDWLNNNKIYFEFFSYVIVGLAAIFISLLQYYTAERELTLHKSQLLPLIRIETKRLNDKEQDTEVLRISNDGEALKKFSSLVNTFYKIQYDCGRCSHEKIIYIPIDDYYQSNFPSNNFKGQLSDAFTKGNLKSSDDLFNQCLQNSKFTSKYYFQKISVIKIDYEDISNERISDYYRLDEIGRGFQIGEKDYKAILASSDSLFHNSSCSKDVQFEEVKTLLERAK